MLPRSYETRNIVSLVFSVIAGIVSLGSVFGSCLMRWPRHDPKAIPFKSLFIFLLSQSIHTAFTVHWRFSKLGDVPPAKDEAMKIVAHICEYLQSILILNTILPSKVHGSTLVSLIIISNAHFITWAIPEFGYDGDYRHSTYGLRLASHGLVMIVSLDIMFKILTIIRKLNNVKRPSLNGAPSLAVGGFFFFTQSLSLLVSDSMSQSTSMQDKEIVSALCITGQSIGIVHCCMQVHKLGIYGLRSPSSANDERAHILTASNEEML
ncbi:uncharacterized protein BO96DRAFT_109961 [Aspergillus niger CBS 101883]|uniref:uncharacterized protein n=1 Tax=Aspergillus lacticoffeatus (strain CBS 101883) TaxID=1450533 RepID=UPI000D7FDD09|nr:uncharacterized protein BO96DRAFT_109961 [Aspergillus niger CBS 101883]PYH54584.1 hypothetical protein BO96DRAFT_109961 [Aspergillus niger CBS 101883]